MRVRCTLRESSDIVLGSSASNAGRVGTAGVMSVEYELLVLICVFIADLGRTGVIL